MLDRIDRLLFYFTIECAICHNKLKASHVALEEHKGQLICSLCGKQIKVPEFELLIKSTTDLTRYLTDRSNQKFVKLTMNEAYKAEDDVPAAAH